MYDFLHPLLKFNRSYIFANFLPTLIIIKLPIRMDAAFQCGTPLALARSADRKSFQPRPPLLPNAFLHYPLSMGSNEIYAYRTRHVGRRELGLALLCIHDGSGVVRSLVPLLNFIDFDLGRQVASSRYE